MILKINFKSETPIYQQLRNQIVIGIAQGKLQPGESLPSVRQLAEDIGINMHTVNKAYSILKNEAFLVVHKRQGVLVNDRSTMQNIQFMPELENHLQPLLAEAFCRGLDIESVVNMTQKMFDNFNKEL